MTEETHHHHQPGESHPASAVLPSILRMGAPERLAIAGLLTVLLWSAVFWAMS